MPSWSALLRFAALVLLVAFITEPQWFEPLLKPLTENNAPAIYNRGSLPSPWRRWRR
jgi:osmoprotectant transport system permease protein